MNLNRYKDLIQAMPVLDQAFVVKAKNWDKQLLPEHLSTIFNGEAEVMLSREDIFLTNRIDLFILKTILWGYRSGMRGKNFLYIYSRLEEISSILNLPNRIHLNFEDLNSLQTSLQSFRGLGLSTYTKLLQLRGFRFDDIPALILDERIIRVFRNKVFEDFECLAKIRDHNKERYYPEYLKCMDSCAQALETSPEHLELFLFTFGNNLKSK